MTPDEAVEAAATAQYEARYGIGKWGACPFPDVWRDMVRPGLEAAAPHIIKAWVNDTSRLPNDLLGYGPGGRVKPAPIYPLGKIEDKR